MVTALVRPGADLGRLADVADRIRVEPIKLQYNGELCEIASQVDPVLAIHAASCTSGRRTCDSISLNQSITSNLDATISFLEAIQRGARRIRCVVRLGSLEDYGDGPEPYTEEQGEAPVSAYSASIVNATHTSHTVAVALGIPLATLRLALVFGPAQSDDFFIAWAISRCLQNEEIVVNSSGLQQRETMYVDDFVEAVLAAFPGSIVEGLNR
jgi:nucleoside-diphosphate-sugar epimerase